MLRRSSGSIVQRCTAFATCSVRPLTGHRGTLSVAKARPAAGPTHAPVTALVSSGPACSRRHGSAVARRRQRRAESTADYPSPGSTARAPRGASRSPLRLDDDDFEDEAGEGSSVDAVTGALTDPEAVTDDDRLRDALRGGEVADGDGAGDRRPTRYDDGVFTREPNAADDDGGGASAEEDVLEEAEEAEEEAGTPPEELRGRRRQGAARHLSAPDEGMDSPVDPVSLSNDEVLDSKSLLDVFPDLASEYAAAADANATPVEEVRTDAATVAAWRCPRCDGVWRCGVFIRCVLRTNCPACAAERRPTVAVRRPDLVQLWDAARNDPFLSPQTCPADSATSVHWRCPTCGQSFRARIKDRVADKAPCPSCAMMHLQSADVLAQEESALLQEWHPLRNGDLRLDQVQPTDSKTGIWWLCSHCGHDWEATLAARLSRRRRSKGSVCPVCKGQAGGPV